MVEAVVLRVFSNAFAPADFFLVVFLLLDDFAFSFSLASLALRFFLKAFFLLFLLFDEDFVGAFTIEALVINSIETRVANQSAALVVSDGSDLAQWEENLGAFHDAGRTFFVQERNQSLTRTEFQNGGFGVKIGVRAEGLRRRLHGLLFLGRISAKSMQDAVAQLTSDGVRNVVRALGDEIHAYALRTHQTDDLLNLVDQGFRSVLEEHMRLVEEEYELGHR